MSDDILAFIPVSRLRSITRAIILALPSLLLARAATLVYSGISLRSSALSTQFVQYSLLFCVLALAIMSLVMGIFALRRALLACWPGRLGFYAYEDELLAMLGPFGSRRFSARRLNVLYPYESADENAPFEALLPEDQQREKLLPGLHYPGVSPSLDVLVTRFSAESEEELVKRLRPAIERWRGHVESPNRQDPVCEP